MENSKKTIREQGDKNHIILGNMEMVVYMCRKKGLESDENGPQRQGYAIWYKTDSS